MASRPGGGSIADAVFGPVLLSSNNNNREAWPSGDAKKEIDSEVKDTAVHITAPGHFAPRPQASQERHPGSSSDSCTCICVYILCYYCCD